MKEKEFKEWLIQVDHKKESTADNYTKAINLISKDYNKESNNEINIYEITDLKELLLIREMYGLNGEFYKFGNNSNGTNRSSINAYYRYLLFFKKNDKTENLILKDFFLETIKEFKYERKVHKNVSVLQDELLVFFSDKFKNYEWIKEFKPLKTQKDSVDIIGVGRDLDNTFKIIIELDTYRADQISKKYLSRMALFRDDDVLYVSLCYPPVKSKVIKKSGKKESQKYFNYCSSLTDFINDNTEIKKEFIGLFLK